MNNKDETAILAGGCFLGVQELLRRRDGVISTRVGYTGGENDNPTCRNHPGHAEAVEIVFDPERISYRDILEFFFQIHDPTRRTARATASARTTARRSLPRATSSAA
jgi:peptide-methionine (S)-S-oxide reductase